MPEVPHLTLSQMKSSSTWKVKMVLGSLVVVGKRPAFNNCRWESGDPSCIPLLHMMEGLECMLVPTTGGAEHQSMCTVCASVNSISSTWYTDSWCEGCLHIKHHREICLLVRKPFLEITVLIGVFLEIQRKQIITTWCTWFLLVLHLSNGGGSFIFNTIAFEWVYNRGWLEVEIESRSYSMHVSHS